jgi:hypothetical protein
MKQIVFLNIDPSFTLSKLLHILHVMAHLIFKNGSKKAVTAEQGLKIWENLRNPTGADERQLAYLSTVKAIFLNWRVAPDDYIQENLPHIIPIALNEWCYTRAGKPSRPATDFAWRFAKRWGLWLNGAATLLVTSPAALTHPPVTNSLEIND